MTANQSTFEGRVYYVPCAPSLFTFYLPTMSTESADARTALQALLSMRYSPRAGGSSCVRKGHSTENADMQSSSWRATCTQTLGSGAFLKDEVLRRAGDGKVLRQPGGGRCRGSRKTVYGVPKPRPALTGLGWLGVGEGQIQGDYVGRGKHKDEECDGEPTAIDGWVEDDYQKCVLLERESREWEWELEVQEMFDLFIDARQILL